jgi:hypothetical protein
MPENEEELDPAASTQMFQAFVDRREFDEQEAKMRRPESRSAESRLMRSTLAAAAVLVIVLAIVWLVLGN